MSAPYAVEMQESEWDEVVRELSDAAARVAILARCLAVSPELARWRAGEEVAGMSAADALDQARGDLERLAGGAANSLLELVQRILDELPVPLE